MKSDRDDWHEEWHAAMDMVQDLRNALEELRAKNDRLVDKLDDASIIRLDMEMEIDRLKRELEGRETAELLEMFDVEPAAV